MGYNSGNMEPGVFFVDLASYIQFFKFTAVNYDSSNWSVARFLKLNDEQTPGVVNHVQNPTVHKMTLSSTVDQTVYVTASTWAARSFGDCAKAE